MLKIVEKKIVSHWKKIGLCSILIFQLYQNIDLFGNDLESTVVRERSNRIGLSVTLHGADSAVTTPKPNPVEKKLELTELRQELLDIHRQKETLERKYHGLQMRIASLFGNDVAGRDSEAVNTALEAAYGTLMRKSDELSLRTNRFASLLDAILRNRQTLTEPDIIRLQEEIAELRICADKVSDLVSPQGRDPEEGCRILDVNPELQLIALSAGYKQGIRAGMVMWLKTEASETLDEKSAVKLKIVEVRPDIAGAILLQGDWRKLVPGVAVTAGKKNKQQ